MNVVKTKNKENDLQYVDLNRKIICKTFNQILMSTHKCTKTII